MIDFDDKIFVYDKKRWQRSLENDYCFAEPPSVREVQNAIILPIRRRGDSVTRDGTFEGGVCDAEGKFVAGLCRDPKKPECNLSCARAYALPQKINARHETVVFGGVLMGHFSHTLGDSMSRLWWFADHPDTRLKLIFLEMSPWGGSLDHLSILSAMGLTRDKIEIISEPTQFDKVIVPQENYYMVGGYRPCVRKIFDYANSVAKPDRHNKKIYLSRTLLASSEMTFNESYFEEFYAKRGFEIVHPERLPFEEQLSLIAGADEIVATEGGLTLLAQFCKPNAKVVFLKRGHDPHISEIFAVQAIFENCYVIDAHFDFLPADLASDASVFFMGPTRCFREYLDKTGCPYDEDEVSLEKHVAPHMAEYLRLWGEHLSKPELFGRDCRNVTLTDVLNWSSLVTLGKPVRKKAYPDCDEVEKLKAQSEEVQADEAKLAELKTENESLKKKKKKLKKRIAEIEKSGSWKVTKPFRAVKKAFSKKKKG